MTIQEINKGLEIKRVTGLKFGNKFAYCEPRGFALYHNDLGFLSFKEDNKNQEVAIPYIPRGGRKALQSILDAGGLIEYDNVEWLQPK